MLWPFRDCLCQRSAVHSVQCRVVHDQKVTPMRSKFTSVMYLYPPTLLSNAVFMNAGVRCLMCGMPRHATPIYVGMRPVFVACS